jgi:hypothetical protein
MVSTFMKVIPIFCQSRTTNRGKYKQPHTPSAAADTPLEEGKQPMHRVSTVLMLVYLSVFNILGYFCTIQTSKS